MTRIGILGVRGRMGQAIADQAATFGAVISGGVDQEGAVLGDYATPQTLAVASDVLVDFTAPGALPGNLAAAIEANCPIVVGTTGLDAAAHAAIDAASAKIAVLQSFNMSLGINLLSHLVREAAARLGDEWDIEILEMHHRHKVDAPSGTALLLGRAAAEGRGGTLESLSRYDRIGFDPHAREVGSIGYASLRGGSVAGDHMVVLAADDERIELGHRAENRRIFARGAIRACQWLAGRSEGRYDMNDVLGL